MAAERSESPSSPWSTLGVLGAIVVGMVGLSRLAGGPSSALVGRDAPDFSLDIVANAPSGGASGDVLHMRDLRGNAILLDFWATWCGPCRAQTPVVDALARRWKDRGLTVVGVDTDTPDQGDPREFALSRRLTYPIVHDVSGEASRRYGVSALPTLVVVSRTGRVIAVRTGFTDDGELDGLIRQAL